MLPPSYRWLIYDDVALLRHNSNGVAGVRVRDDGKWEIWLYWHDMTHRGVAASQEQGIRWVTRWVAARGHDLPGASRRGAYRR
ncbi:hypothetical protein ACP93_02675 [Xanthomonas sp. NCPPB 1128]|nr:hypothetical protein ACP93_02410 [Xanthomonas sp. NCPPB 1128]KMM77126.1 hypothetical protein ACP93_02675 [Xanthomonas sp. NCPPB 1128]